MTYREDQTAWPTMVQLAACLDLEVRDRDLPTLCRSIPVPGPTAVLDACGSCTDGSCGGQGWVRLVNEFPSSTFPQIDTTGATCDKPTAYVLEVGISRCIHVGTTSNINGYTPPSIDDLIEDTRIQMADKAAILAAIKCCMGGDVDMTYSVGSYTPLTLTGDCGGGFWQVTVWSI